MLYHITKHRTLGWWYVWVNDGTYLGKYLNRDGSLHHETWEWRGGVYANEEEARQAVASRRGLGEDPETLPLSGELPRQDQEVSA